MARCATPDVGHLIHHSIMYYLHEHLETILQLAMAQTGRSIPQLGR
jgi:hypothetical protein